VLKKVKFGLSSCQKKETEIQEQELNSRNQALAVQLGGFRDERALADAHIQMATV
jgi:hypothetical protein